MTVESCTTCGGTVLATRAPTGHLVGATYESVEHRMRYVVEALATKWECAPGAAVRCLWANGNVTVSDAPVPDDDVLVCPGCVDGPVAA